MTHLRCPLCNKYVAISSLQKQSFDPELEGVTFHSKGRGRGFEKGEEYPIPDDDETAQLVRERISKLATFYFPQVQKTLPPLTIDNKSDRSRWQLDIEAEMKNDFESQVDFVLRHAVDLKGTLVTADDRMWFIKISDKDTQGYYFFKYVFENVPGRWKSGILEHIKVDGHPIWFEGLKGTVRKIKLNKIQQFAYANNRIETVGDRIFYPLYPTTNETDNLSWDSLRRIVSEARKDAKFWST